MKLIIGLLLSISSLASAQVCPKYDESKQIKFTLVDSKPCYYTADGELCGYDEQGVERAYLRKFSSMQNLGPHINIYNSANLFIGKTLLSRENYNYYALVFKQLSNKCPVSIVIDRKSLSVVSFSPACDPYQ